MLPVGEDFFLHPLLYSNWKQMCLVRERYWTCECCNNSVKSVWEPLGIKEKAQLGALSKIKCLYFLNNFMILTVVNSVINIMEYARIQGSWKMCRSQKAQSLWYKHSDGRFQCHQFTDESGTHDKYRNCSTADNELLTWILLGGKKNQVKHRMCLQESWRATSYKACSDSERRENVFKVKSGRFRLDI